MRVRIFMSSPGDLGDERAVAGDIVERLQEEFEGRLQLETYLWELDPLRATSGYQSQIPPPGEFDVVVVLFWGRLGTPLKACDELPEAARGLTGTQYELEMALQRADRTGSPDVLLYRKKQAPVWDEDASKAKAQAQEYLEVDAYLDRLTSGADGGRERACPGFSSTEDFARKLEVHLRTLLARRQEPDPGPAVHWRRGCPYLGLVPFGLQHAKVFHGRRAEALEVVNRLRRRASDGPAMLLISGASGVGKSSLAHAGVQRQLTAPGVIEGVSEWRVAALRPGDHGHDLPAGIADSLTAEGALPELLGQGLTRERLIESLRTRPASLESEIRHGLSRAAAASPRARGAELPTVRLLWIVDQLEEILAPEADANRESFAESLELLCSPPDPLVWVLGTVRSDLVHRLHEHARFRRLFGSDGTYLLGPPTPEGLREIIVQPAQSAGARFESVHGRSLDQEILDDALQNPSLLPLLQFALKELWDRDVGSSPSSARLLTFATYRALGNEEGSPLVGALTTHADGVVADLLARDVDAEPWLDRVLLRLVRIDAVSTSRRALARAALEDMGPSAVRVAEALVRGRLLMADRGALHLAHEALIRHWSHLTELIARKREFLQIRARVESAAAEWDLSRRNDGERHAERLLTGGLPVEEGRALLEQGDSDLEPLVQEFVRTSIEAEDARRNAEVRAAKRRAHIAECVTLAVLALCAVTVFALSTAKRALQRRTLALASAETGAVQRRELLLELDPDFADPHLLASMLDASRAAAPVFELARGAQRVRALAVSRNGRYLAAAWEDGEFAVLDLANLHPEDGRFELPAPTWCRADFELGQGALEWSQARRGWWVRGSSGAELWGPDPDGGWSRVPELREWGSGAGPDRNGAEGTLGRWRSASFAEGGAGPLDAAPLEAGAPAVGKSGTGALAAPPASASVEPLAPDPRGERVAFASEGTLWWGPADETKPSGETRLREADDPTPPLERHELTDEAWCGDRPRFVVYEPRDPSDPSDRAAFPAELVESPEAGLLPLRPLGWRPRPMEPLLCVACDDEGSWLVAGSEEGTVQLWSAEEPALLDEIRAHEGAVEDVLVDPAGRWWASAGADGRVCVWAFAPAPNPVARVDWPRFDPGRRELRRGSRPVTCLEFDPGGRWLALAPWLGETRLWAAAAREGAAGLDAIPGFASSDTRCLRFSPDGARLAALGDDGEIRCWRLGAGGDLEAVPLPPTSGSAPTAVEVTSKGLFYAGPKGVYRLRREAPSERGASPDREAGAWEPLPLELPEGQDARRWHLGPGASAIAAHLTGGELAFWRPDGERLDTTVRVESEPNRIALSFDDEARLCLVTEPQRAPTLVDLTGRFAPTKLGEAPPRTWSEGSGSAQFEAMACLRGDGRWVAAAYQDGAVAWWDLSSPEEPRRADGGPLRGTADGAPVLDLAFHPSEDWLACVDRSGRTRLWDLTGEGGVAELDSGSAYDQARLAFHPTEPWLAVASTAHLLRVWSLDASWIRERLSDASAIHERLSVRDR